jgi:hypothetical protein
MRGFKDRVQKGLILAKKRGFEEGNLGANFCPESAWNVSTII